MKEYVNDIIARITNIVETCHIPSEPRIYTPNELVGLVTITLTHKQTQEMAAIDAREIKNFLFDVNNVPTDFDMSLGCMFVRVEDSGDEKFHTAKATISPKILNTLKTENYEIPPSPVFKMIKEKNEVTWDYTSNHDFVWCDVEGNDDTRFLVDLTTPIYVDIEYLLMLIIGNDFLFRSLANVVVNYFTYFLEDESEISAWGNETYQRLLSLHRASQEPASLVTKTPHTLH